MKLFPLFLGAGVVVLMILLFLISLGLFAEGFYISSLVCTYLTGVCVMAVFHLARRV